MSALAVEAARKHFGPELGNAPCLTYGRLLQFPFVVVGGVATRLYAPERVTDDLDILIKAQNAATLAADIAHAGGSSQCEVNGMALDVLEENALWAEEAIENPASAPNGLPVISLPYLVLMKMRASRGIDIGDLTRILGPADDAAIAEVSRVVAVYLPDGVEDLEGLVYLGRLEYGMPH